ncbi:SusC/RagA family TonB-linked outer membrane protein [Filimonas effusa]|nr:SusC/RagA family TonB-linked outer membrane protein [Filimonas effusa]
MKLTAFFMFVFSLHLSARTLAQRVTVSGKDLSLKQVCEIIKKQTGYEFMIDNALVEKAGRMNLNVKETSITEVLDQCLTPKGLAYTIKKNVIIIYKKTAAPALSLLPPEAATPPGDIRGRLTDASGRPVSGALVRVRSKTGSIISRATVTNDNGEFVLPGADPNAILLISAVNIEPVEMEISGQNFITVVARNKVAVLNEIAIQVNTGYQVLNKERASGAFEKPDMQIVRARVSTMDIVARLEGQVAGLQVAPGNSGMSAYSINYNNAVSTRKSLVRGVSTVSLSSEPLYVVNGIPVSDFSSVNPDDIEDITVLKDAAAAAIWGSRAANGVIVITTRSGSKNQRLTVSYNGFINYSGKPDFNYQRTMNSREYIQAAREVFDPETNPWPAMTYSVVAPHDQVLYDEYRGIISKEEANRRLDSLASIDNLGQIKDLWFRPAFTTNHTISASGGNDVYSFYGSLAYTGEQSNIPGEKNQSYKLNFRQDINAGNKVKVSVSTSLINRVNSGKNAITISNDFIPYQLFKDASGKSLPVNYLVDRYNDSLRLDYQNRSLINLDYYPLDELNLAHSSRNNLHMNVTANVTVKLLKGLSFMGTYGYVKAPGTTKNYTDNKALALRKTIVDLTVPSATGGLPTYYYPTTGGAYMTGTNDQRNYTIRNQLVFETNLRHGRDHLSVQAGQAADETYGMRTSNMVEGYNEALGTYATLDIINMRNGIPGTVPGYGYYWGNPYSLMETYSRFNSYSVIANYTIDHKYSIDGSWRRDHSNMFGSDVSTQNKPVWSVGTKWQISRENFMKAVKWVDDLGIRATYGITGNSPYAAGSYQYDVLRAIVPSDRTPLAAGDAYTVSQVANNKLVWENSATINLGLDFSILNRRLSGGINYYHKVTTDLIGTSPSNPLTGVSTVTGNIGKMVNKGIEVSLTSQNIRTKDFNWSTSLTLAYNKNKLVSYTKAAAFMNTASFRISGSYAAGYSMSPVFAYRYAGLDDMGDPQIELADKTVSKNPSVATIDDVYYMGTSRAPYSGGLTNTLSYKGISMTINTVYSLGGVMRNVLNSFYTGRLASNPSFTNSNYSVYFTKRWKHPGDEATTDIPSFVANEGVSYSRRNIDYYTKGDVTVISASFLKIRDITLGYDLPSVLLRRLQIQSLRIYGQATNFLLWAKNNKGIDPDRSTGLPAHNYSLGINLTF